MVTLSVSPDGEGRITIKTLAEDRETATVDKTRVVPRDRLARFFTLLDQAHFWTTPTELPARGLDGSEWIMEGVKDGQYRTVVRWCPDWKPESREEAAFAKAGHLLFKLAGQEMF